MPRKTAVTFDERKIDAIFADLDQGHLPGAAVGIAIGGMPVYRRGFGLANMELPVVLAPTIRMRLASTTKHFAALAFLLLCEDGKATIDDPIGRHLPELHPVAHAVTLRQLMGHVGGLRDAFDICHLFSGVGQRISSPELLSFYREIDDVNAAPGVTWNYNNGGYMMLSAAIERIADRSLEEVLHERIFAPVGMNDTLLRRFDTDFLPNSATPHMTRPGGGFEKSYVGSASDGCGGMVSTIDDMLRWLAHMDAPWVGTKSTWALMRAPQTLANGCSTSYGLGLHNHAHHGVATIGHSGNIMGSSAQMLKAPAAGLDVVVMVNRGDVSAAVLADRILDACLPELGTVQGAPEGPFATGLYRSPQTGRVVELAASASAYVGNADVQQIASIDGAAVPLARDGAGAWRPAGIVSSMNLALTFKGDPERPASIRLSDYGNVDELVAVTPVAEADVVAIAGRYSSRSTGTEASISQTEHGLQLSTIGRFGSAEFKLEAVADRIWRATAKGGVGSVVILTFDADGASFHLSSFRTRGLPFRRC